MKDVVCDVNQPGQDDALCLAGERIDAGASEVPDDPMLPGEVRALLADEADAIKYDIRGLNVFCE